MPACGSYPLLPSTAPGLGGELQESQQDPQPQAQAQNQEHPLEAVGMQGRGFGRVGHTAAGPPLTAQVGQLPSLTQLEDGHTQVL